MPAPAGANQLYELLVVFTVPGLDPCVSLVTIRAVLEMCGDNAPKRNKNKRKRPSTGTNAVKSLPGVK